MARDRFTYSLDVDVAAKVRQLSEQTDIPQGRLVERGIQVIIKEYEEKGYNLKEQPE